MNEPKKLNKMTISIFLSFILIILIFVLTFQNDDLLVYGHVFAGAVTLAFALIGVIIGAMITGRIKKNTLGNLLKIHLVVNGYVNFLIIGTFLYGIWARVAHGEPLFFQSGDSLMTMLKGWLGVVLILVAMIQILPCIIVKNKQRKKQIHMVFGYLLLLLLIAQTLLGVVATLSGA
ncbi:MAG TPA: hypothetical protein DSN98_03605 [Thermoplasmata archaeon]|jgi:hypothetical protein|nr:MAG TPA: hypothetical protein DSN98_03605 [Thermoplasmata archaeon]